MLVGLSLQPSTDNSAKADELALYMVGLMRLVAEKRCKTSYEKVFSFYAPKLRHYALKQWKNDAQAMELVQETMTNVWLKAHLFDGNKGAVSTWIFAIARNVRYDLLRKYQQRLGEVSADEMWPVLLDLADESNASDVEHTLSLAQVMSMVEALPENQRLVMKAIYIDGHSQQQVADMYNLPLGTVKSRTRLALQRIKQMIDEND